MASTTKVANLNADTVDGYSLDQGVLTSSSPTFVRGTFSQSTGTSPFVISSTTVNTNLNADMLDGLHSTSFLLSNMSVVSAYRGTSFQAIPTTTATTVIYNTESYDSGNEYNTATGEFTAAATGYYFVTAGVNFVGNATGIRYIAIQEYESAAWENRFREYSDATGGANFGLHVSGLIAVAAGNKVRVQVYQSSGGDLNLTYAVGDATITIHRVK